jgi:hypothetical protein
MKKADREKLNHERPTKGLPVRMAEDARPNREKGRTGW